MTVCVVLIAPQVKVGEDIAVNAVLPLVFLYAYNSKTYI